MSLAENLLNSITGEDNISTFTSNMQEEGHIVVGSDRRITVPAELRNIAIIGDKDVETVTIDCIRYWDGHDLSTFAIYLNYLLPNRNDGSYIPQNIRVSENQFSFDWTIERHMTAVAGAITISIGATKTDENGMLLKQWGSFPNSDMIVSAGLPISNVVNEEEQKDLISQIASSLLQKVDKSDIVDATGNAHDKVISQYGTTEAINKVYDRLEMAEKRLTNIEGGLSDESFVVTTDGLVPPNSLPYARVLKVGGMTYRDEATSTLKEAKPTHIESRGVDGETVIDTLAIPEAVQALDGYGLGINADCYNHVDWEKKQFVQNVGKYTLTGTETVTKSSAKTLNGLNVFYISPSPFDYYLEPQVLMLADKYKHNGTVDSGNRFKEREYPNGTMYAYRNYALTSRSLYFVSDAADVATFKQSITGMNVLYKLAEPIVTDISDLLPDDNFIEVEGGGTIVAVNENNLDAPTEIRYQVKVV